MSAPVYAHATALRLGGRGLLLRGRSGSGKSSLALSILRRAAGAGLDAVLIADDQVFLTARGGRLHATAPSATAGLIEIRGIGILPERHVAEAPIDLMVDLVPRSEVERMPAEDERTELAGIALRIVRIAEHDPGFGADILLTLAATEAFWCDNAGV